MYHVIKVSSDKLPITWKFGKDSDKRLFLTYTYHQAGDEMYLTLHGDSDIRFYSNDGKEFHTKPCTPKNSISFNDDEVFYKQVKTVYELIRGVYADGWVNREVTEEILKDYLEAFFTKPIQHRGYFSSYDIWVKFAELLRIMGLKASDLVPQSKIDNFLCEIIRMREFKMYRMITRLGNKPLITVTKSVRQLRNEAQRNLNALIARAKTKMLALSESDFEKVLIGKGEDIGELYIHRHTFSLDDKYFGKVKVWVEYHDSIERFTATLIFLPEAFATNIGAIQDITPKKSAREWQNKKW